MRNDKNITEEQQRDAEVREINQTLKQLGLELGEQPKDALNELDQHPTILLAGAEPVKQIRDNAWIYKNNNRYILVKDPNTVLGYLQLSAKVIAEVEYLHLDLIYILPRYRKTSAAYWLIYAVKELVDRPVIADGAIFADGVDLITAIRKHRVFSVSKLNIKTGEKSKLDEPIYDADFCYIFEQTKLDFGKQILPEGLGYTWYPFFGEI